MLPPGQRNPAGPRIRREGARLPSDARVSDGRVRRALRYKNKEKQTPTVFLQEKSIGGHAPAPAAVCKRRVRTRTSSCTARSIW